jgi:triacylglycerol esterase/lipase EstA (alpha/beta hydrolase family)
MRPPPLFLILLISLGLLSCSTHSGKVASTRAGHFGQRETTTAGLISALSEAEKLMVGSLDSTEERQAYATAVMRVTALWLSVADANRSAFQVGTSYVIKPQFSANLRFDELIPAKNIQSKQLKKRMTREGVGVPMVAHWRYNAERKATEPFLSEAGYITSVTATLDFTQGVKGQKTAHLVLHDSRVTASTTLQGRKLPLAADLSAYGEYLLSLKRVQMQGIKALLRSADYMDKLGLLALEHPDKNRIPLVLVHGLMSRPATWENVINEFGTDPDIQRHYQVYLFRYPSGVPVVFSSEKLREHLATLHGSLVKEGSGRACKNMVLIGHSMGGLVSKAQVQDSGDRLWVNILGDTPAALGLSKSEYEALRRYLEFDPNPNVSRVMFAATPHRGSQMADSRLAHFARGLVKLPSHTFGSTFQALESIANRDPFLSELIAKGIPTSVDNLSPESPYVKIANSLPFRSGVHLHSIIGNKDGKALTDPKCSDGVVPYSSSHLDKTESEVIVKSDHGVHEKQEAIEEMRRILRLHLRDLELQ